MRSSVGYELAASPVVATVLILAMTVVVIAISSAIITAVADGTVQQVYRSPVMMLAGCVVPKVTQTWDPARPTKTPVVKPDPEPVYPNVGIRS